MYRLLEAIFSVDGVQISAEPSDELLSLQDWLTREPELRGRVRVVGPAPSAGQLGSAFELLSIAVGTGGLLSVLAASLKTWLARPRRSDVRITIRTPDQVVEIDAKRVGDVDMLLRRALPQKDRT